LFTKPTLSCPRLPNQQNLASYRNSEAVKGIHANIRTLLETFQPEYSRCVAN
jgi:hypothetical protein